jgi:hypothetical protein
MAGMPGRSGGQNRLSVEQHRLQGTFRADRHGSRREGESAPVSAGDRRRTLQGLPPLARRVALALLEAFDGWSAADLLTLRAYALSAARLEELQTAGPSRELHRELRAHLSLLKALNLEASR